LEFTTIPEAAPSPIRTENSLFSQKVLGPIVRITYTSFLKLFGKLTNMVIFSLKLFVSTIWFYNGP